MKKTLKWRGKKIAEKFTKFSRKASHEGTEHVKENVVERISHIKDVRLSILEWGLLVLVITILAIVQAFWYKESFAVASFRDGGTFIEGTLGKVNSLNPLFATTESEEVLAKLMFARISSPDYSGHIGPELASSITMDDTGKIWTVKLRDNLKWSDGENLTNKDVIFTVGLLQNSNINSVYSANLTGVSVTEKEGNLIFTLPAPYINFSSALDFPILPEHILADVKPETLLDHGFSTSPITSGPFTYNATQSIGTEGEKIVYLLANDNYYAGRPMLDSFTVHAFLEKENLITALNSSAITATAALHPNDTDKITSNAILNKQTATAGGVFAFFNTESELFSQLSLRRAVQQGLDMRSLRAPLDGETNLNFPILEQQVDELAMPELPNYDPDAAKSAIKDSLAALQNAASSDGLPAEEPTLHLVTVSNGYLPDLAENLKYQLENLGFKVEVAVYEANQDFLLSVIRPRAYDILLYEVELGPDPDLFAYYHSSQASETGLNFSNYRSSFANDSILAARSTISPKKRITKYQTFLKTWLSDVPAIAIYQTNLAYFVNKNVRSFSEDDHLVNAVDRFNEVIYWATEHTTKNRTP